MKHLGDFDTSAVIYGKFTTYRPSTGASHTLGGTPALSVYKDNSTTQSTSGVTLTADFDSVTGLNHFAIDTSADGTFYAAGSFFDIVITTGTVDSVSVTGSVVASFTLRKNSALKPTTAGRTLDVSSGGEAGVDWANVGSPTTTVNLSGTTVKTATDVETDTADIQSRLPAALVSGRMDASVGAMAANVITAAATAADFTTEVTSGLSTLDAAGVRTALGLASANLDTQLADLPTAAEIADAVWDEATTGHVTAGTFGEQVKTDIDAILVDTAEIGAAGAGLTAVPWNAAWDAEVQSECTDALNAYDPPTRAELTSDVGTLATAANLATVDTVVDAIKAKTDSLTFTVAGQVDANVQSINDVTITGDGQSGTEFGV